MSNGQDTIGEVSDLVVTDDGRVEALVVGGGAFLGIGAKPVALAWDSIKLTEQDGSRVILVSATREQLEGMPTYKTLEDKQAEADVFVCLNCGTTIREERRPSSAKGPKGGKMRR